MQIKGINLGPTRRRHGHGRKLGRRRECGRKAEAAAPKLVYATPYKVLHNLIN
jgi:hypothetical protein